LETLPSASLRDAARELVERYGGILTRHEFPTAFSERRPRWESARLLQELGSRGLGTVGHVDLRTRGLGIDDDAVLLFHEVVERYVEEWRGRPLAHDSVLSAHGDLMSDVTAALLQIQESPVRVGKEGSVYKAARARLGDKLVFPPQPLVDREELAERVVAIVRGLALAREDEGGQLVVTEDGAAWAGRPLIAKVAAAYEWTQRDGGGTLRSQHLARLHAQLIRLIVEDADPSRWWPGSSLAMCARNRYLLELAREDAPSVRQPLSVRQGALTELGLAAQDLVVNELFALGLVDVARYGSEPAGVRLSNLGRRLLLKRDARRGGETRALVVNPDFEMLVLPEGDVDDLLHALDRIAVRVRSGEVVHYHLDREKIERASVAGEDPEGLLEFLRRHSRTPVPQNVEYSIRSWGGNVRSASLARGLLFIANDPAVVESIVNHPVLRGSVEKVLGPTAVFFNEKVLERQVAQELRALGVYVR
ncbi:MAG: helicase-associated domain-containing protein, partial [Planctomycetota bacterium]